jgi:hypothetical protein
MLVLENALLVLENALLRLADAAHFCNRRKPHFVNAHVQVQAQPRKPHFLQLGGRILLLISETALPLVSQTALLLVSEAALPFCPGDRTSAAGPEAATSGCPCPGPGASRKPHFLQLGLGGRTSVGLGDRTSATEVSPLAGREPPTAQRPMKCCFRDEL